ncbi:MAG: putative metal-binding motif-containing protein, partial [Myxococcota bacterium]
AYAAYVADWDITEAERLAWVAQNPDARLDAPPGREDCDDADPTVWPGALETFASDVDSDCNGVAGVGGFVFGDGAPGAPTGGYAFTDATNPELARLDETFLVFVAGNVVELEEGAPLSAAGVAIPVSLTASGQRLQAPTDATYPRFKFSPQDVGEGLDIAQDPVGADVDGDGVDDPRIMVLVTEADPAVDNTLLSLSDVRFRSATGTLVTPPFATRDPKTTYVPSDLEVGFDDDGNPFAFACAAEGALHSLREIGTQTPAQIEAEAGELCFVSGRPASNGDIPVWVCAMGMCTPWIMDTTAGWTADGPTAPSAVEFGDNDDGAISRVVGGLATVQVVGNAPDTVLVGIPGDVVQLDAHVDGTELYVAGILDDMGARSVWLERTGASGVDRVEMSLDAARLAGRTVDGVAVYGDADRVVVAIRGSGTGGADVIGWVFMNP